MANENESAATSGTQDATAATRSNDTTPSPLVAALQRQNPEWVVEVVEAFGETTVIVPREHIAAACSFLKTAPELEFNMLADICGVDRGPEEEPRFEVNYHLFSTGRYHRVRLKVVLNEDDPRVQTITGVWKTANWHERETFDMFGIIFEGHPDLRRILLPDDWEGHALRKDFPLRGYEPYSLT
ncbi:MAG TPA: NADH-quinone oxidoreductase subunit C [Pyrinomonadaceae bacterium]|jgi:NADH-quinone oxidoreductase subunit C|nr:NADH-quinone oxidoreductase subunit C [Pyrinomonadaceae bacterium]